MKLLSATSLLTAFLLSIAVILGDNARAGTPAQLQSLTLESGSGLVGFASLPLAPSFNSGIQVYDAIIPFEHDTVNILSAVASPGYNAEISLPSSFPAGATSQITFDIVEDDPFNPFPPVLLTYTVNVTRGAPNVTASLANLVLAGVPISPTFDQLTFRYTATVGFGTTSVSLVPTAADNDSTITVNGDPATNASPTPDIPLNVGTNRIVVLVISADETVTKGYEVVVTRLQQDSDNDKMEDFWEFQNGLIVGLDDGHFDKDEDGLLNVFEYAFGSDPCDPADASRPQISIDGSGFAILSFSKAITDGSLVYTPEVGDPGPSPAWSNDLTDLTPGGDPQNQVWRDNAGGAPTPPAQRWLRVRLDVPAP